MGRVCVGLGLGGVGIGVGFGFEGSWTDQGVGEFTLSLIFKKEKEKKEKRDTRNEYLYALRCAISTGTRTHSYDSMNHCYVVCGSENWCIMISVQEQREKARQGRKDEMSVCVLLNAYAVNVESFCAFAGWTLYRVIWCLVMLLVFFAFGCCVISGCIGFKQNGLVWSVFWIRGRRRSMMDHSVVGQSGEVQEERLFALDRSGILQGCRHGI